MYHPTNTLVKAKEFSGLKFYKLFEHHDEDPDTHISFRDQISIIDEYDKDTLFISEVILPDDAEVDIISTGVYMTDKFTLGPRKLFKEDQLETYMNLNTLELCKAAVTYSGDTIRYALPFIKKDIDVYYEVCEQAISSSCFAFRIIIEDSSETTFDNDKYFYLCLTASKNNGYVIKHIVNKHPPDNIFNDERYYFLYRSAVNSVGQTLEYLHSYLKQHNLDFILANDKYAELCMIAVHNDGKALQYAHTLTPELCEAAVRSEPYSLEYVKIPQNSVDEDSWYHDLCEIAVSKNPFSLRYVIVPSTDSEWYSDICELAVKQNCYCFKFVTVPKNAEHTTKHWYYKLCEIAVATVPSNIDEVDSRYKTKELFTLAISKAPYLFEKIKDIVPLTKLCDDWYYNLCKIAVSSNPNMLSEIDIFIYYRYGSSEADAKNKARYNELVMLAIQNGLTNSKYIRNVTPEIAKLMIPRDPEIMQELSECPSDLCKFAVQQDAQNIKFLPFEKRTPEIYKFVVEKNWKTLQYVDSDFHGKYIGEKELDVSRTRNNKCCITDDWYFEVCKTAVDKNGMMLEFILNSMTKDEHICSTIDHNNRVDLCFVAVKQNGFALKFVDKTIEYYDNLCQYAVKQNGLAMKYVDESFLKNPPIYSDISYYATVRNGLALGYVKQKLVPDNIYSEICKNSVTENGLALQYVSRKFITPELCRRAVSQNGMALQYVIPEFRTPILCANAVFENPKALKFVTDKSETMLKNHWYYKVCESAAKQSNESLEHMNSMFRPYFE